MPNAQSRQTMYLVTGNPDTLNVTAADFTSLGGAPGELGAVLPWNDREYQLVHLDSGATASTPTGAVAANEIAFWKDRDDYLVTNDRSQALGGAATAAYANQVAGVFRAAVTAGNYCCILQKGTAIPVKDGGNTFLAGELVWAELDTAAAINRSGVGTMPSYQVLGVARGAASGGNVNCDLNIPAQP